MSDSSKIDFVHLHVHTEYSLLDGSAKIDELIERTKELGMNSIAITDHGAMYGAIEFYKKAKSAGIKPIIGCEVYLASGSRFEKGTTTDGRASKNGRYTHLILLAENNQGYQNLIKLVSYGFTEGYYYKPRIDKELLKKYHEGLICTSACIAGEVPKNILQHSYEEGKKSALEFVEIFGEGNFFLELQDHGIREQKQVNIALEKLSEETGIPLIATNDMHYIYEEDAKPHEVLLCIQTKKTILDADRMIYYDGQFYMKSPEEMQKIFPHLPKALENTQKIADRCNVEIEFHELKLPEYDVPDNKLAFDYLKEICYDSFNKNYHNANETLVNRLEYELNTIKSMGFVDYFLIVWDFIKYAKDNGIVVGPGRGSAAGSMVSYCLSITTIDPIKYDLIFERFLNPERVSMPDIDIDFCYERRQEVIDYVVKKYGEDNVAQIITFGTLAARAAIKDVGRALDIPYAEVNKISKMIPSELGITIEKAIKIDEDFATVYTTDETARNLIDTSKRLEGLPRHTSTHAAGVVICKKPVVEYVPLSAINGQVNTQYTMNTLEELGILKMDFLGLRTLTVIKNAVEEIKRMHNVSINIDEIPIDDEKVYKLISQGKTEGVFQLESAGMKNFMKELQPNSLEDLIAGISLYRPGPMEFIPDYIKGKNDKNNIVYKHEKLENILSNTYGCIVYQEQVMEIVRVLAGYSLGRSDLVRRAMSKKKEDVMEKERQSFIFGIEGEVDGCIKNGIGEKIASEIFDDMTDFAKYAFNKSHAACYALVGYQTAWLKTHYPVEFMAALMTSVMDRTDKITGYVKNCKELGIELLPPDINESYSHFSVSNGKIRFALSAVKNVGEGAINSIVLEREKNGNFKSLTDLCNRMSQGIANKKLLESLIKTGAFDSMGGFRQQYINVYPNILSGIAHSKKNNIEGQVSLFDIMPVFSEEKNNSEDNLPDLEEFSEREKLAMEKEITGIYLSGHPLAEYEKNLALKISHNNSAFIPKESDDEFDEIQEVEDVEDITDKMQVSIGGIITSITIHHTKRNEKMAFVTIEDFYDAIEVVVFPKIYKLYENRWKLDTAVCVRGKTSIDSNKTIKILADSCEELYLNSEKIPKSVWIKIPTKSDIKNEEITSILVEHLGDIPVYLYYEETREKVKAQRDFWVDGRNECVENLQFLVGKENVVTKYN